MLFIWPVYQIYGLRLQLRLAAEVMIDDVPGSDSSGNGGIIHIYLSDLVSIGGSKSICPAYIRAHNIKNVAAFRAHDHECAGVELEDSS